MFRGIERRRIFLDDEDHGALLQRLGILIHSSDAKILAWVLLSNHAHLLFRSGSALGVSRFCHRLLGGYANSFNRRHRRYGHLFQGRFKSILVEEEPYLLELVRYIHLNPVRAGIVADIEALDRYSWSGHSRLLGMRAPEWQSVDEVLARFGTKLSQARRAYRNFVADGWTQGRRSDLTGGGLRRSRTGWAMLDRVSRGRERWASDERILGSTEFVQQVLADAEQQVVIEAARPHDRTGRIDHLVDRVAAFWRVPADVVRSSSKERRVVAARAVVSHAAVVGLAARLADVARALGVGPSSVLRGVRRGANDMRRAGVRMADLLGD
jgi:REP element-mobilizing transposase RayT